MLSELEIKNLGPIRAADVTFSVGMTAITGETGAGKSMLLNALSLVRGGQAESSKVSAGESGSWAQAVFDVSTNPDAKKLADDAGVSVDDDELFLTRQVPQNGRSKAILSGHTVPRSVLGEVSDQLVTVHGQSDQLRLVAPAKQRDFLDSFAANSAQRAEYATAWQKFRDLDQKLIHLASQQADARQRADYLRESIELIERLDPQPHEDEELKSKRDRIENAAAIVESVGGALAALDASQIADADDAPSVISLLSQAENALRGVANIPELSSVANDLGDVSAKVSDIVFSLSSQMESVDTADADLDQLNERIHALSELTRRWGPSIEDVRAWMEKAQFELEDVDASPEKVEELRAARRAAYDEALETARRLHDSRRAAAAVLAERVSAELDSLAMPGARLTISVEARSGDDALSASGIDDVEFLFTAFPGAGERPLGKSASGGELSRLMLALELCLADRLAPKSKNQPSGDGNRVPSMTFVFDEIDAGVGGETAVELGKRLARLARTSQVIVVTHLAQVASWAQAQFVVSKGSAAGEAVAGAAVVENKVVETTVTHVEAQARVEEIARMLSGSDSRTSLQHAQELLAASTLPPAGSEK